MTTTGMNRFDGYAPPSRGAVDQIKTAADKALAHKQAVDEIREIVDSLHNHAVIPSRRIRQILKRHGL